MATPWWLTTKYNFDPEQGSSQAFYDAATGRQVYERGGQYYYSLPTEERFVTGEDGQWQRIAGNAGELVGARASQPSAAQVLGESGVNGLTRIQLADGTVTTGTALSGDAGDYSKLFEGMVPGANGYLQAPGQGAPQMQIVRGQDGTLYAAAPQEARFNQIRPDNSGFMSNFTSGFAPIVMAALSAGLGNGITSSLADTLGGGITGQLGSRAIMGGASSLLSGGDPITGALSGGLGGALGSGLSALNLDLPSYATSALTGGIKSAITGGDPLTGALMGAGSNLAGTALNDLGFSAPATSAIMGGARAAIGGGDPLVGAITSGSQSLLTQVGRSSPDLPIPSQQSANTDLLNAFSSTPSPQSTVDTLAANTTGVNPATAWSSNTFDNWDASLGQLPQSPSPADTQVTTGQPLPEPFQQAGSSSLPWDQPAGSLNTYTEQQPVTSPAQPVTTSPASGGGNMSFFDDLLAQNLWGDGTVPPDYSQSGENPPNPSSLWPTTPPLYVDPALSSGQNYLETGMWGQPGDLNLGMTQDLSNSGNMIPLDMVPGGNQTQSAWDKLLASMNPTLAAGLKGLTQAVSSDTGKNLISRGLAAAPALAAINYARNQTPYDTSQLSSVFNQMNPSAQVGMYDMASGQQKNALQSDLARRQVAGSSFGDQSLASFNTIRDLGRNALLNQGLAGQADVAAKMVDAQAKQRAAQNQLYGSALYALGGALSPRTGILG